jgi:uncharacterized protein YndB with AHSA1/START domain
MEARSSAVTESGERELVITRVFDAPRSLVFKAWTEPEHMAKWFGPQGFTSTVLRNELRPGGAYRIYMRGPEGDDHWMQGIYREIVEPQRLVMVGCWADAQGNPTRPETTLTLTFEDIGAKTKMTLHQTLFESVTARNEHQGCWSSSFERLAEYLKDARAQLDG